MRKSKAAEMPPENTDIPTIININYPLPKWRRIVCEFKERDVFARLADRLHVDFDETFIHMLAYLGTKRLEDADLDFFMSMCHRGGRRVEWEYRPLFPKEEKA